MWSRNGVVKNEQIVSLVLNEWEYGLKLKIQLFEQQEHYLFTNLPVFGESEFIGMMSLRSLLILRSL